MIEIFLGRDYESVEAGRMLLWCQRNTLGMFSAGGSAFSAATIILDEEPWMFEREDDATLFALTWS